MGTSEREEVKGKSGFSKHLKGGRMEVPDGIGAASSPLPCEPLTLDPRLLSHQQASTPRLQSLHFCSLLLSAICPHLPGPFGPLGPATPFLSYHVFRAGSWFSRYWPQLCPLSPVCSLPPWEFELYVTSNLKTYFFCTSFPHDSQFFQTQRMPLCHGLS